MKCDSGLTLILDFSSSPRHGSIQRGPSGSWVVICWDLLTYESAHIGAPATTLMHLDAHPNQKCKTWKPESLTKVLCFLREPNYDLALLLGLHPAPPHFAPTSALRPTRSNEEQIACKPLLQCKIQYRTAPQVKLLSHRKVAVVCLLTLLSNVGEYV